MSYSTNSAQGGLSRITDAVLSYVAQAPVPVIEMEVFNAIEEFCRRSCLWREQLSWTLPIGVAFVDLNPVDASTLASSILRVTGLHCFRYRPPAVLVDFGQNTVARYGTALVVCKPLLLNEFQLPSAVVDDWSEAIRDGAVAKLLMMPGKPWSDSKLAMFFGQRYTAGIFRAKESVRRSGDLGRPTFPYFANGSQRGWGLSQVSFTSIDGNYSNNGASYVGIDGTTPTPYPIAVNDEDADIDAGPTFTPDPDDFGDVDGGTY